MKEEEKDANDLMRGRKSVLNGEKKTGKKKARNVFNRNRDK